MPWVVRGSRKYFYRSIRAGGRILRQYLGSGRQAHAAAREIEHRRAERQRQSEELLAEQERHQEATVPLDELVRLTDLLARATLVGQGYHQHQRGDWRRRRHVRPSDDTPG